MFDAAGSHRGTREFGLHHALGFSVGVHGLLLLAVLALSRFLPHSAPIPVDTPLLKFTFNRGPEIAEPNETPRGTVPDPTPPSPSDPAVVPNPNPAGGMPSQAAPPPSPAQAPQPQQAPSAARAPREERERPTPPTEEPAGLDAQEREDAEALKGAAAPRRDAPQRIPQDLDVKEALRDYQKALERAKARRPLNSSAGSSKNVFVPDTSAMPMQGTPYGILEFTSRDYDWSDYYRQIYWDILKAWYRRMSATTADFEKWAHENSQWMLNHQSRISFVIHRSGDVSDIVLETDSGCVPLDASAMDGLSEVILVPLPDDFPRESEQVHATFIASGEIASMRQYFAYLKRINFF